MIGMEIYVVDDRIVCRWRLQYVQMAVTFYQELARLFPQTWQCHHLIVASIIVSIIQPGMSGKDPKLDASSLQCTLSSSRLIVTDPTDAYHNASQTIPHTGDSEKPTPMVARVEFVRAIDGRPAPPDLPPNVARLPLAKTG
jgi:hypothetical protein